MTPIFEYFQSEVDGQWYFHLRITDNGVIMQSAGYDTLYELMQAIDLVKKLHSQLYGIYSIGWDIAIGEKGPLVIEGNENWDFRMFQVYYGGCKKALHAQLK